VSQGEHLDDEESFFDLLSRFQSKRMDDQRCSLTITENKENTNLVPKSNHNNNPASSIKPMMPLNNSNAANSKTNGKICTHQNVIHSTSLFSTQLADRLQTSVQKLIFCFVCQLLLYCYRKEFSFHKRSGMSVEHGLKLIIAV
jgi:GoLoco motif.